MEEINIKQSQSYKQEISENNFIGVVIDGNKIVVTRALRLAGINSNTVYMTDKHILVSEHNNKYDYIQFLIKEYSNSVIKIFVFDSLIESLRWLVV